MSRCGPHDIRRSKLPALGFCPLEALLSTRSMPVQKSLPSPRMTMTRVMSPAGLDDPLGHLDGHPVCKRIARMGSVAGEFENGTVVAHEEVIDGHRTASPRLFQMSTLPSGVKHTSVMPESACGRSWAFLWSRSDAAHTCAPSQPETAPRAGGDLRDLCVPVHLHAPQLRPQFSVLDQKRAHRIVLDSQQLLTHVRTWIRRSKSANQVGRDTGNP